MVSKLIERRAINGHMSIYRDRITTGDLMALGISSRDLVETLRILEQRWRDNGYRLTKRQLIDSLYVED